MKYAVTPAISIADAQKYRDEVLVYMHPDLASLGIAESLTPERSVKVAIARMAALMNLGLVITCPFIERYSIDINAKRKMSVWMHRDLNLITKVDGIILAPEWMDDRMSIAAYGVASGMKLKVYYLADLIRETWELADTPPAPAGPSSDTRVSDANVKPSV